MDYKQKYLKYKTKYLLLKEQLGGDPLCEKSYTSVGGKDFFCRELNKSEQYGACEKTKDGNDCVFHPMCSKRTQKTCETYISGKKCKWNNNRCVDIKKIK